MKILFLILIAIVIYLAREINILKLYLSKIPQQNIQTIANQSMGTPHSRLLQWSSEVSPNNLYRATSYTGDYGDRYHYYQVFITELATDRMHRIYAGDFRTMDWEWTKDNKIKISYNCGTACKSTRIIDVDGYVSLELDKSGKWITQTFKSF